MFNKIKEFFLGKPKETAADANWPFPRADVDAKASTQTKCGCGRSQSGFCVGLHSLTPEDWATHADNPNKPVAAKKPRARKAPAEKPATPAEAVKKPRARKTPAK
jgi:hypothetical protein